MGMTTLFLVSFMILSVSVEGSVMDVLATCETSEKPTTCEVRPANDPDNAIQQLEKSLVSATSNVTVYSGQTALFRFEVNNSVPPMDFYPVAYINECQDKTRCTLESLSVLVCTIYNVTLSDDGMEVYFYSVSHGLLARLCYDPPSYLTVLGPLQYIANVSIEVDPCEGINLSLSTPPPPNTNITYSLHDNYTSKLLIYSSFPPNSTTTNIPANLLTNHSGLYWIVVTATNLAGNGPPTNITIDLSQGNNSLNYSINSASLETGLEGNTFKAIVTLQVNPLCPLTVPNVLFATSSCAYDEWAEYPVNMTRLLEDSTNQITLRLPLIAGQRSCNLSVKSEGVEDVLFIDTGQSTFLVQSYSLHVDGQWIIVNCSFIIGLSTGAAAGCYIRLVSPNSTVDGLYLVNSNDNYTILGPLLLGVEYTVYVYDYYNGTYNEQDPVYSTATTSIPLPSTTTSTSTSPVLPTTITIWTTMPMTSSTVKATDPGPLNPGQIGGIIAGGIIVGLVVIVVALIVVAVVWNEHTKRDKRILVQRNDDNLNQQNAGDIAVVAIHINPPDGIGPLPNGGDIHKPLDDNLYNILPIQENPVVVEDNHHHGDNVTPQPEGGIVAAAKPLHNLSSCNDTNIPKIKVQLEECTTNPCDLRSTNRAEMVLQEKNKIKHMDGTTETSLDSSLDDLSPLKSSQVMFTTDVPSPSSSPSSSLQSRNYYMRQGSNDTVVPLSELVRRPSAVSTSEDTSKSAFVDLRDVHGHHRTASNTTLVNLPFNSHQKSTLKEERVTVPNAVSLSLAKDDTGGYSPIEPTESSNVTEPGTDPVINTNTNPTTNTRTTTTQSANSETELLLD